MNGENEVIEIAALDFKGRGVGRSLTHFVQPANQPEHLATESAVREPQYETPALGKVVFIEGALLGERVTYRPIKIKRKYIEGQLLHIDNPSNQRVIPRCVYFEQCGGCAMQHVEGRAQVSIKQRQLENNLQHIGKVKAAYILQPIVGHLWNYRYRARLSVRYMEKRGSVLIGFHQKESHRIVDMQSCDILPQSIASLLPALRELITSLSVRECVPQIEVAIGEQVNVLCLRILKALTPADQEALRKFADVYGVQFWLQPGSVDSAYCFYPQGKDLYYVLPDFGIRLAFRPADFTQVNPLMNQLLVSYALRLLDVHADERVLDLFCGLGNFTLPLATQAREVLGIEGSDALCERARQNAVCNQLAHKTQFLSQNLFEISPEHIIAWGKFDRWLIDPPRDGALTLVRALVQLQQFERSVLPKRLVYVSCDPATLARDAGILVNQVGYRLSAAGVVNMFPHTAHIESIAVFDLIEK